jgi:hypothetical protein
MIGSLVVVGTGMDAIRHLTPESRAAIEGSDKVFYCVCDAAAELLIKNLNPNSVDLFPLYSEEIPRYVTYRRMTEAVVEAVHEGLSVCMIYYGHPGVCATSPHAAITEVRKLGGNAKMLPGVSSHDALLADLGIDPGLIGCQIYEATSYLTRLRSYDPDTPLILYQLGAIGDLNYYEDGFPNICLHLLIDMLAERYGPKHPCVLYSAPNMPFLDSETVRTTVSELRVVNVRMAHTLLVPPIKEPPRNKEMIDEIHRVRDEFYERTGRPKKSDWPEYSETFDEHPGALIYNRSE